MNHWFFYIHGSKDDIAEIPLLETLLNLNTRPCYGGEQVKCRIDHHCPELEEPDDGTLYGLYAWTSSHDVAKLFRGSRNPKYFICKKMDISIDTIEWESLHSKYKDYEIIRTSYSDDEGHCYSIPMTHFESDIICDNYSESMEAVVNQYIRERNLVWTEDDSFRVVLDIFDKTLEKSLELLSWSSLVVEYGFLDSEFCTLGHAGDDPEYLVDLYYDASSYGEGITGYRAADYDPDIVSVYIFMLGELLG